jgi:hypothetical protein
MENSIESPPKIKNRTSIRIRISFVCVFKGNEVRSMKRYLHPHIIAMLFTIAKIYK